MKKGGYKIIDFKGTALSGTAVELPGIYDQIVDDYDKPIMVSGVTISGELQDDAYASVKGNDSSVDLTVYGGIITVTEDDEVTFTLQATPAELAADVANLKAVTKDLHILTLPVSESNITYRIKVGGENYVPIFAFAGREAVLLSVSNLDAPVETKITENSPFTAVTNVESKAGQFEVTVTAYKRVTLVGWRELSYEVL